MRHVFKIYLKYNIFNTKNYLLYVADVTLNIICMHVNSIMVAHNIKLIFSSPVIHIDQ